MTCWLGLMEEMFDAVEWRRAAAWRDNQITKGSLNHANYKEWSISSSYSINMAYKTTVSVKASRNRRRKMIGTLKLIMIFYVVNLNKFWIKFLQINEISLKSFWTKENNKLNNLYGLLKRAQLSVIFYSHRFLVRNAHVLSNELVIIG